MSDVSLLYDCSAIEDLDGHEVVSIQRSIRGRDWEDFGEMPATTARTTTGTKVAGLDYRAAPSKFHIRRQRPASSPSYGQIDEDENNWVAALAKDPDATYCGKKGKGVLEGRSKAREAGITDEDICDHCKLHAV